MKKLIDEQSLASLRKSAVESMSPKRATHTVAVEAMAIRLGELYAPDKINIFSWGTGKNSNADVSY